MVQYFASSTLSYDVRVAYSESDEKVTAGLFKCHRIKVEDKGRGSGCQHRAPSTVDNERTRGRLMAT